MNKFIIFFFWFILLTTIVTAVTTQTQSYDLINNSGTTTFIWTGPRYWNGSWQNIDTTVQVGNFNGYDYAIEKGIYQMYYKQYVSYGDAVRYCLDGWCFTSQPSKLTYRNTLNSNDDINSSPSNTAGIAYDNTFIWTNIFGNATLYYSYDKTELKERLVLPQKPREPNPTLGNLSLVTLDLDNYLKFPVGIDMYVDGVKVTGDMITQSAIEFRNSTSTLYTIPSPSAYDSNGNTIQLTYQIVFDGKYNANKQRLMWFYIKTPYSWLNSTSTIYPVTIDPDLTVNSATTLCGLQAYDNVVINATVTICDYNATSLGLNGTVRFDVINFTITILGKINGVGRGYYNVEDDDGTGPGGGKAGTDEFEGGGGGGYGNAGGNGGVGAAAGGVAYGSAGNVSDKGSAGGWSPGNGLAGDGGGYVFINASDTTTINGFINVSGLNAEASSGSGGGAGGGIRIKTKNIAGTAILVSKGGASNEGPYSNGGGGGAGGRILIQYCTNQSFTYTNSTLGGAAGSGDTPAATVGGHGTTNVTSLPSSDSLCNLPPTIGSSLVNSSSINQNEQIRINVSVTDVGVVNSVWAEFKTPDNVRVNKSFSYYDIGFGTCSGTGNCAACETNTTSCTSCPGCSFTGSVWNGIMYSDFNGGTTGWDAGVWDYDPDDPTWCVDDTNDDCILGDNANGQTNYSSTIDTSLCVANSIKVSGSLYDYGVDASEYLYMYAYNVSDAKWKQILVNNGGSQGDSKFTFNISINGSSSFINAGFKLGFAPSQVDSGEFYTLDDVRVSCNIANSACEGTLTCASKNNNETGCLACNQCNVWADNTSEWYYDWTNTSQVGTYNVTNIWANDTYNFLTTISPILGWIVTSADTCTYSSGNWVVAASDNCTLSTNLNIYPNNFTMSGSNGFFKILNANFTYARRYLNCATCKYIREGLTREIAVT